MKPKVKIQRVSPLLLLFIYVIIIVAVFDRGPGMIGKLIINRYELLEKIGEGGMGIVYKAKCHSLNRLVAVKILKSEFAEDEDYVARFKSEATSAARMSHPNIVNVHDVGRSNNINFIVMEYINGKTLKQVIKDSGRLSLKKTIDIACKISRALECAHKNNIIHRDIKPDNILLTEDNIVKVADFGIAKVADSRTVTNSSKVMGTVHYFSPEQAKGSFVDVRTDIYSLGILMYEMVTGRVPYDAESSISIAMMHIQQPVIPPIEIIEDIPKNINGVILKAMEKEPINRYQTAKEMEEVLTAINKDSNFILDLNNSENDTTRLMDTVVVPNVENDYTAVISGQARARQPVIKKSKSALSGNKSLSKSKKILIVIASIILVIIIAVLGNGISKENAMGTQDSVENTIPKDSEKLPLDLKKFVPTLTGSTQDIASQTIVDNGFTMGNISKIYSDSISKGLVISQTPNVNTSYEVGGKIDLVISAGKRIDQVTVPDLRGKTINEAEGILEELKLQLGEKTLIKLNTKGKYKTSKNSKGKIFLQNKEPGTLVNIETKINVSYYEGKNEEEED